MRAREFIVEQRAKLDPDIAAPMHDTYIIPGIRNNDAYHTMRLGTAIARARADAAGVDRKSTRLNSSHMSESRMPSSA